MLIGSYHLTPTSVVELLINMTIAIIPVVVVDQITKLLRQAWSFFSSSNGDPAQERQLTAQPCQSPRDRRPSPARSEVTRAEGPMPSSSPSPSRHRRRSKVVETEAEELADLGKEDWARLWIQVIRELRNGVKLKHVSESDVRRPLYEFALTPYEILMDDIRSRRWNLNKVVPDDVADNPDGTKKDAHDIILDFIRSRPPLAPAEERKLNPLPESSVTPRDRLMEELNQGEAIVDRLKPVPKPRLNANQQNGVNNQKKVLKADISILLSNELEESDEELDDQDDDAFLEELYRNRLNSMELETSPRHVPSVHAGQQSQQPQLPQKKKITPEADLSPLSPLVGASTWAKAGMEVLDYVPGPKAPVGCLASDLISLALFRRQEPRLIDYIDLTQDSDSEDSNIGINAPITTNRDEESEDCSGRQYSPSMPRLIDPCCVCLGRQPETVLIPCGHFVCDNCAPNLHRCPICRSSFTNHYKTFR